MKVLRILVIGLIASALLSLEIGTAKAQEPDPLTPQNPVVQFLAGVTHLTAQEVAGLQQQGYGLGNISKAYYLVKITGSGDIESFLAQAKEIGWGNVFKKAGLHPGGGHGMGWLMKSQGQNGVKGKQGQWIPPGQARKDKKSQ